MLQVTKAKKLSDVITSVIIIAYNEDTTLLQAFFAQHGISAERQVGTWTEEERKFPSIVQCFMNHQKAWEKAAKREGSTLIVEADFVPVKSLFDNPVFWPIEDELSYGYLYQISPRILDYDGKFIRAHSVGLVAYAINRQVAEVLLDFFVEEKREYNFTNYFTWDVHVQWFCMKRGVRAYISDKQLGEHGGRISRDHSLNNTPRHGRHRADRLAGQLAFKPFYVADSYASFLRERIFGRLIGLARLLGLRWTTTCDKYTWTLDRLIATYLLVFKRTFL